MAKRTLITSKTAILASLAIIGLAAAPIFPQSGPAIRPAIGSLGASPSGAPDAPSDVSDYPGKPAPILLSPFAQASLAVAVEAAPPAVLPGPPDLETESQRRLRLTAATTASVVGFLFNVRCTEAHPLSVMACPGAANGF